MKSFVFKIYGLIGYALGILSLLAFVLFANNGFVDLGLWLRDPILGAFAIDLPTAPIAGNPYTVNLGLILIFGLQHSIMARPGFKVWLTKIVPSPLERSTYVMATALAIFVLILFWQPLPDIIWQVQTDWLRTLVQVIYWCGWGISFLATQMIDGLHLMGIKQSFSAGKVGSEVKKFVTPAFYGLVRHPIQTGIVIAMLATPDMTAGRAVLAFGVIFYIFVGLYFEERDLIVEFGSTYQNYKKRVPALFPKFW